jgi:hypothetical protein
MHLKCKLNQNEALFCLAKRIISLKAGICMVPESVSRLEMMHGRKEILTADL